MDRLLQVGIAILLLLQILPSVASAASLSWQQVGALPANDTAYHGLGMAYGNEQFVVIEVNNGLYTSRDGREWASHTPNPMTWTPVKFLKGQFFAGGNSGIGKSLMHSNDGLSWQIGVDFGGNTPVLGLGYGKGRYIVGRLNGDTVTVSSDLKDVSYSRVEVGAPTRDVAYGKGLFVGVANGIHYTSDGMTWTEAVPRLGGMTGDDTFFGATYGEGRFVAVGRISDVRGIYRGVIYTSTDGEQWEQVPIDTEALYGVIFGGGRFVAWGQKSILTSEDGKNWTAQENTNGAGTFAYGGGRFMALGHDRTVMTAMACGMRFPDVAADDPACDSIEALARQQILAGYPDGSFRPGASVTRAELAKMLVLTRGLKPEPEKSLPFSDTANHWAARDGYLQAAVEAGMVNGFPDGTFRPNDPVTRAQAAKMVASMLGLKPEPGPSYADITGSEWFAGWVAAARNADLIGAGGYHAVRMAQEFSGNSAADRGESAILLDNLANY